MSEKRRVLVYDDRASLIAGIADRFVGVMTEVLAARDEASIVLTGGTVGIAVLAALGSPERVSLVDWERVHLWWGDERWLPAGDAERNDEQAREAFLDRIGCPPANIHRFPSSDGPLDLDAAARAYSDELARASGDGERHPAFDLVFLGVGPDAHIASLFPGREEIREREATVIPVRNSPKPPPERLSLTLPVINSADRVWLCLSGTDKATALGLALAGANVSEVPAAGAEGRLRTVFLVDSTAAADVPQDLLTDGGVA
ncbi:6-phosphogluconolactonase [Cryobacterium mesophilum]|uniref:6-phosphogluconolactonase n=1 Tax=Terrimesophilobacter mesophilus TaxID=433647 RepID=A0A4R8VAF7_9MICO|nr:6-phosphogluconolactonase [Terrimesophilobacter mesophilus]MBB5631934.1 6-phosphogluconolactonase [Terrimesophilobacter mesophilus]TFB78837.1 6-phosphogluconolactonase [Terrimesophilobacter mesophilus]